MHSSRPRRAAPLTGAVLLACLAPALVAFLPQTVRAQAPAKLLLQSICVLGTSQEYVSVYNPGSQAVDLSNYYLTDALFTNQSYAYITNPTSRTSEQAGGGQFTDWHVRFPAGAMIAAGDTIVVGIQGASAFQSAYGRKPHFEVLTAALTGDDVAVPNMREAFPGSVPATGGWGLTNSGESVTLYFWDQQSDLVTDIDYMVWGNDSGQFRYFNNKTGLSIDGPDANTTPTAYQNDTPAASQSFFPPADGTNAHIFGNAMRRENFNEGTQTMTGGNGIGGRDETSENLAATWSATSPAAPPFVKGTQAVELTARAGGPYSGTAGTALTFNGSTSTAATGQTITGYSWNFGDGTPAGTGVMPQHTYAAAGSYTVTLTVTQSGGATAMATTTATIAQPGGGGGGTASKLLFQAVCVLGTTQEYVSVYNPNGTSVDLSNYYITDALFTGQTYGVLPDPARRTSAAAGGGQFTDWHVRFPAGAVIAAGDTVSVAIQGSAAFQSAYGRKPHFEIVAGPVVDDATTPNMREAFPGSVPTDAWGLTNGGESVTLYYWNQETDLVTDIDYVVWGNDSGQFRYFNNKTGVMVDGPDADNVASTYLADTPAAQQSFIPPGDGTNAHAFGNAMRRENFNEGTQRTTGGNGVGGRDETSENLATTWSTGNPAVPPFVKGSAPAQLTARAGGPYSGTAGTALTFNGSTSTAATGQTITGYSWNFGDGTPAGTGVMPQHTYAAAGNYTVTLTVTQSGGATAMATTTATIAQPGGGGGGTASKLLFQAVCVLGTTQEYVSVYNPNGTSVDLSNYYITDALFTGQTYGVLPDPARRTSAAAGGGQFTDWHVRFPAGAVIAAGDTVSVAIQGSAAFQSAYGRKPHFEIVAGPVVDDATTPNMREAFPGSVPTDAWGLTNGGESVTLYYWNQETDLVTDIDYVVWGNDSGQFRYFNNKTGVMVDGPDADNVASTYLADTPAAQQSFIPPGDGTNAHAFGNAMRRENFNEGTQRTTGGNGVGGRDETSENLATTWSTGNPAVPPFVKGSAPPPPGELRAVPGGPYRAFVDQGVTFNGSGSTPATGQTIVSYIWNFGDSETASGATVTHAYDAPGTYTVSLTVTGSGGGTDTRTTTAIITVPSDGALQLPGATFLPSLGEVLPITLDVEAGKWQYLRIYDLEGREVRTLLDGVSTGKTTINWDGRDEELMLAPAGTYIGHLEVRDESGNVNNHTGPIVVARRLERN